MTREAEELDRVRVMVADMGRRLDKAQKMIMERENVIKVQAERLAGQRNADHYDLIALRRAVDDALDLAVHDEDCHQDAVNWGDLSCTGAEWYIDDDGVPGHRVWIEECDPAAWRLRDFVRAHLEGAGFAGIHVMLEW